MGFGHLLRRILTGNPNLPDDSEVPAESVYRRRPVNDTIDALAAGSGEAAVELKDLRELARRLGLDLAAIQATAIEYQQFTIPKASGGTRVISAPSKELKALQHRIINRLLKKLPVHRGVTGFCRGKSIVHNAMAHVNRDVVIKLDIRDFFHSTTRKRLQRYFLDIGWDDQAAALLVRLCTHEGHLPQGAPTSPMLSNLVNYLVDQRLSDLAHCLGASYSRYADDMTFSMNEDDHQSIAQLIRGVKMILKENGYRLHQDRKLQIRRQHDRQMVTGLVVNSSQVNLPRDTRRWLRAVEHRAKAGREITISPQQLAGWQSLRAMVQGQRP